MNPAPESIIECCLGSGFTASFRIDRKDPDGYYAVAEPNPLGRRSPFSGEDFICLLPSGSDWNASIGWHSYFGVPFFAGGTKWLALGTEKVVPHRSRGGYVTLVGLVFPFDRIPLSGLHALACMLDGSGTSAAPWSLSDFARLGELPRRALGLSVKPRVIRSTSSSPEEHRKVEAQIIAAARAYYAKGQGIEFRTLALSPSEVYPRAGHVANPIGMQFNSEGYFFASNTQPEAK